MTHSDINPSHSWLKGAGTSSKETQAHYDAWAEKYNDDLQRWAYQAPVEAAQLLKPLVPDTAKILDAGCGTGLTGIALKESGYSDIVGIDISNESLVLAEKTMVYSSLHQQDLQEYPFSFKSDEFDAVNCIGVLTYIEEPESLFREFCRIVRPGGYIVFTHREDLIASFNYPKIIEELTQKKYWKNISTSNPKPYLPKNEDFSDEIKAVYYIFQTLDK